MVEANSGKPVLRSYIKVYARKAAGKAVFYKYGYTDLLGKFDYASISTDGLDGASRFALLVMSENNGALVREAAPPAR